MKVVRIVAAWCPAVLYMGLVWVLSTLSHPQATFLFPYQDKVVHAVEFGGLALAFGFATRRTWPRLSRAREFVLIVLYASMWGLLDELHQAFVPGRTADLSDLMADATGATAAALLRLLVLWQKTPSTTTA